MTIFWQTILSTDFLYSVFRVTTPILLCTLGSVISSSAGVCNLALEGTMLVAAFSGVLFSALSQNAYLGLLGAILGGVFFSLLFAFSVIKMKVNDIISGIALNLMATGVTTFFLFVFTGEKGTSSKLKSFSLPKIDIPIIKDIPIISELISGHHLLTYIAILLIFVTYLILKKTRFGLRMRSVGIDPDTAKSVGINIDRIMYLSIILSGCYASLGGAYLSMGYLNMFTSGMVAGKGYIAVAAEAMGGTTALGGAAAAVVFGLFDALANTMQSFRIPSELIQCVPYVATIIGFVIICSRKGRKKTRR